jgi:uncharacterized RDD family membrane protein YckC
MDNPKSYAGFWRRCAALCIDNLILFYVYQEALLSPFKNQLKTIINYLIKSDSDLMYFLQDTLPFFRDLLYTQSYGYEHYIAMERITNFVSVIYLLPIYVIVVIMYFSGMESSPLQATIGKLATGLYVTDTNGERISFGRAAGRFLGKFLSGLFCYIGYIIAGFTEKKQALHDMIAGCLVLRK